MPKGKKTAKSSDSLEHWKATDKLLFVSLPAAIHNRRWPLAHSMSSVPIAIVLSSRFVLFATPLTKLLSVNQTVASDDVCC